MRIPDSSANEFEDNLECIFETFSELDAKELEFCARLDHRQRLSLRNTLRARSCSLRRRIHIRIEFARVARLREAFAHLQQSEADGPVIFLISN